MTIQLDIAMVIYVASCIGIVGAAVKVLAEFKKKLMQPLEDINKKLEDHDKFLANDKAKLEKIDYVLSDLTDSINMLVKSHKTVLMHMEDGNHTGEIKEEIAAIDKWLLESRSYRRGL